MQPTDRSVCSSYPGVWRLVEPTANRCWRMSAGQVPDEHRPSSWVRWTWFASASRSGRFAGAAVGRRLSSDGDPGYHAPPSPASSGARVIASRSVRSSGSRRPSAHGSSFASSGRARNSTGSSIQGMRVSSNGCFTIRPLQAGPPRQRSRSRWGQNVVRSTSSRGTHGRRICSWWRSSPSCRTYRRRSPASIARRGWLNTPGAPISGVLFVSIATQAGTRHRVRSESREREHGDAS